MAHNRLALETLEQQLLDEGLYSKPGRKDDLAGLVLQQGQLRKELESLEWSWLEASEALENADKNSV